MGGFRGFFYQRFGFYQPGGQPHQPGLQCCRHPQRRLSLYQGRPHGLAVNLGGYRGTLPGRFIGAFLRIKYLPDPKAFKLFAGCVLLYIGLRLVYDLWRPRPSMKALEAKFNERVAAMKQESSSRVAGAAAGSRG